MDDNKLTADAREIIKQEPVWISAAVVWEMLIKKSIGKLKIPQRVDKQLLEEGFKILDIKLNHVMMLEELENHHSDPFDRIQIAQAKSEGYMFVTKDRIVQKYQGLDILAV